MSEWNDTSKDIIERIHAWEDADTSGELTGRDWYYVAADLLCEAHDVIDEQREVILRLRKAVPEGDCRSWSMMDNVYSILYPDTGAPEPSAGGTQP